jgi:hypothetical protein
VLLLLQSQGGHCEWRTMKEMQQLSTEIKDCSSSLTSICAKTPVNLIEAFKEITVSQLSAVTFARALSE